MIKLSWLTTIPMMFSVLVSYISNNIGNKSVGLLDWKTSKSQDFIFILQESSKNKIGYVMQKALYTNILPLSASESLWYDYSKKIKEKEKEKINIQIINDLKKVGLLFSLIMYFLMSIIWMKFDIQTSNFQLFCLLTSVVSKLGELGLGLLFAIDGVSLPFILLVGVIMPIVYLSNWTTVERNVGKYVFIIILLELFLIAVFIVIDLILFFVFFESTLPLLFVLIGLFGATEKFRAGYYIFLYTFLGSMFMLLSFSKGSSDSGNTNFKSFDSMNFFTSLQELVWIVLLLTFSVKTPIVPFHIWLPLAHSDANVSGSIILASIVLKLALYGFIRILIGIYTIATVKLIPSVLSFCSLSLVYSSFTTIRQFDLKVLVAYSSVAHMASTLFGTFSDTLVGLIGSILFGLAHGFVSPGLFFIVGAIIYDRFGSRFINYYKGLSNILPLFALFFLFFVFGNMGVPLTANFLGEFLSLLGAYQQNIFVASLGALSIIISAVYSIFMYNRVTSGSISPFTIVVPDVFRKEHFVLLPLLFFTIIIGIYPYFLSSEVEFGLSNLLLFTPSIISFADHNNDDNRLRNTFSNLSFTPPPGGPWLIKNNF